MWRPVQVAATFTVSLCGLVFQVQKSNAQIGASDLVLQGLEKLDYRTADTSIVRPLLYLAFILVSVVQLTPDVTVNTTVLPTSQPIILPYAEYSRIATLYYIYAKDQYR